MKNIIFGIYSILLSCLQFIKIYTCKETKISFGYVAGIGFTEKSEIIKHNYNFIQALASDIFPGFYKFLAILFFITPIIVGLYFLFSKKLRIESRNLDLIFCMVLVTAGLMVFMITNTFGHVLALLPIVLIVASLVYEIRR